MIGLRQGALAVVAHQIHIPNAKPIAKLTTNAATATRQALVVIEVDAEKAVDLGFFFFRGGCE